MFRFRPDQLYYHTLVGGSPRHVPLGISSELAWECRLAGVGPLNKFLVVANGPRAMANELFSGGPDGSGPNLWDQRVLTTVAELLRRRTCSADIVLDNRPERDEHERLELVAKHPSPLSQLAWLDGWPTELGAAKLSPRSANTWRQPNFFDDRLNLEVRSSAFVRYSQRGESITKRPILYDWLIDHSQKYWVGRFVISIPRTWDDSDDCTIAFTDPRCFRIAAHQNSSEQYHYVPQDQRGDPKYCIPLTLNPVQMEGFLPMVSSCATLASRVENECPYLS